MAHFEALNDRQGSALLGWVEPGVLYARFSQTISEDLATRFASRFGTLIADNVSVRYFTDSSSVISYDLRALAVVLHALTARRQQFQRVIARPWQAVVGERALEFAASFGCLEYVTSAADFEARLRAAAPSTHHHVLRSIPPVASVDDTSPAVHGPYTYVFDLSQFESGFFTATRWRHLCVRPSGTWTCVARDDEQALKLAQQAAVAEWAQPVARHPEHFTVQFTDFAEHLSRGE
jgi:hypothetical protein